MEEKELAISKNVDNNIKGMNEKVQKSLDQSSKEMRELQYNLIDIRK